MVTRVTVIAPLDADTMTVEPERVDGGIRECWGIPMHTIPDHLRVRNSTLVVSMTDAGEFLWAKENDKRVVVRGWNMPELRKILENFKSKYEDRLVVDFSIDVRQDPCEFHLTFPSGIPTRELACLVVCLHDPGLASDERSIEAAGFITVSSKDAPPDAALIGRDAVIYLPTDEQEVDVAHVRVNDLTFQYSLSAGRWRSVTDPGLPAGLQFLGSMLVSSAQIASLVQRFVNAGEPVEHAARPYHAIALYHGVLPLMGHFDGIYAINDRGDILHFPWNVPAKQMGTVVTDSRLRNGALYLGSSRYPELSVLVPKRPATAPNCALCDGTGEAEDFKGLCRCFGLGWWLTGVP
jgi:hypothetical protein